MGHPFLEVLGTDLFMETQNAMDQASAAHSPQARPERQRLPSLQRFSIMRLVPPSGRFKALRAFFQTFISYPRQKSACTVALPEAAPRLIQLVFKRKPALSRTPQLVQQSAIQRRRRGTIKERRGATGHEREEHHRAGR
ncbi:MAG: hypothetical protein KJ587_14845 [Alphaproteobacteria bacterium]|nr:hypothetical protein [Alphaproteobacteria bacterium]